MKNTGVLKGITVLDLSRLLPGPFCSMILADHGARVIAIESKKFVADGLYLKSVNRNKEHISLDLKTPEGKAIFLRLLNIADVLLEGFRPGVTRRLGIDYKRVSKINPKIVYCSITGYGQSGPYRNRVGHDVNCLGVSGVLNLIGEKDKPPAIPGVQLADMAGGGMNAAIGVLLALFARERTGKGQHIDISMTDGMVSMLPVAIYLEQIFGQGLVRSENVLSHRYAFYNTYETADGRYLSIGALEQRFWKILCETLDKKEYIPLQYDEARRLELIEFMKNTFKQKPLAHWEALLGDKDVCWAPIHDLNGVRKDPHLRHRDMFVDIQEKNGSETVALGVPVKLSHTPGSVRKPPVEFGENTADILSELGYSKKQIADLEHKGVV